MLKPPTFLTFGMEFSFISACGPHANNAHALTSKPGEYNNDDSSDVDADRDPALARVMGRNDQRIVKKRLIQIGEIQPVLFEVGAALRFVPNDLHDLFVVTICVAVK